MVKHMLCMYSPCLNIAQNVSKHVNMITYESDINIYFFNIYIQLIHKKNVPMSLRVTV